jgi:hypothetical protein
MELSSSGNHINPSQLCVLLLGWHVFPALKSLAGPFLAGAIAAFIQLEGKQRHTGKVNMA